MNERIRELAEQAGVFAGDFTGAGLYSIHNKDEVEKFAELIVRECCLQVADVRIENDFEPVGDAALAQALAGIKQYFGVEE
jgi:hypothetical protein